MIKQGGNMKKAAAALVIAMIGAGVVIADQVVRVDINIKDAAIPEITEVVAAMPPLYTNTLVVVTNDTVVSTNVVRTIVPETTIEKFKRYSAGATVRFWKSRLRRYRELQERMAEDLNAE
jgi:hypothetical protein